MGVKDRLMTDEGYSEGEPPLATAPAAAVEPEVEQYDIALSKRAQKRELKRQIWEETREQRKAIKKEKLRNKKSELKRIAAETGQPVTKKQRSSLEERVNVGVNVVIDCDFDALMTDKEIVSITSQIQRCYSDNRNASKYTNLIVSSHGGRIHERMETTLTGQYHKWKDIMFAKNSYLDYLEANGTTKADISYI